MMEVLDDQPKGKQDYDVWISDGVALGKGKDQGKAIQPQKFAYIRLLNKPYENEVTLRRQNPPLKCC